MKTVIVYRSKSGYTRFYAEYLKEALSGEGNRCSLMENIRLRPEELSDYDTIIYGGGLYAGGINGISLITRNLDAFAGKNIVVWATGASPGRPEELQKIWERYFPGESGKSVKTFYLRGGFDFSRLRAGDKILMRLLKAKLEKEKNPSEDMKGMLRGYEEPFNFCRKENCQELLTWVKGL